MAAEGAGGILCVWDFDWSLVNENSDTWVVQQVDPVLYARLRAELRSDTRWTATAGRNWTEFMDYTMTELHTAGYRAPALAAALEAIPIFPEMLAAAELASQKATKVAIVSDANTWFIDVILKARKALSFFDEVVTNPGEFEQGGAGPLRVLPQQPKNDPHGCDSCPPNMCKGKIIRRMLAEGGYDRVFYCGDGGNDVCAALNLRSSDFVMARDGYTLSKRIAAAEDSQSDVVKPTVMVWKNGEDVRAFLDANL